LGEKTRGLEASFQKAHLAVRQNDWLFVRQQDARLSVQSKAADSYMALSFGSQDRARCAEDALEDAIEGWRLEPS